MPGPRPGYGSRHAKGAPLDVLLACCQMVATSALAAGAATRRPKRRSTPSRRHASRERPNERGQPRDEPCTPPHRGTVHESRSRAFSLLRQRALLLLRQGPRSLSRQAPPLRGDPARSRREQGDPPAHRRALLPAYGSHPGGGHLAGHQRHHRCPRSAKPRARAPAGDAGTEGRRLPVRDLRRRIHDPAGDAPSLGHARGRARRARLLRCGVG